MSQLAVYLLGLPRVELDGVPIQIARRKALALLIYLALTSQPHSRDSLATLFWPGYDQTYARANLRRTLSTLNQALAKNWLEVERESVALPQSDEVWVDVAQFRHLLVSCEAHGHPTSEVCPACLTPLSEAVAFYHDDFLTGFTLSDSPDFDDWQLFQAEALRQELAEALERLVQGYAAQEAYKLALAYARRWLALNPLHEPAHRRLMQLYVQAGDWTAALRQYQECVRVLKQDLDVSPSIETTVLFERIRQGGEAEETSPLLRRAPPSLRTLPWHNLPPQPTAFIGREEELAEIQRLLLHEPDCRLLTLVGPGGIGKTRLALAAAEQMLDAFPDGTYFVSLAPVGEVEFLIPAIAEALKLTFYGKTDPKEQLLDHLRQKRLLLVVDNFEHLLDGASLLLDILNIAPGVTLLVTSRERLNLREEWGYEVQGLPFPTVKDETSEGLTSYSAVQLFLQRARQIEASFTPSAAEVADIGRICQLVEGLPLGLELAAPWIRTLSCREIALEIQGNLDFLTTWLRNMPERHRSLRVVFEQTWRRLSAAEQTVLRQLSVFRGGCTREAAEQVTGATLPLLSSLVDKALLRRTNTGRYELHELIRQFAEAQLQTDPAAFEQAQQRHRDNFIAFLEARTAGVKGGRQKETVAEIKADIDNVRLAWRRAVASRDVEAFERAAECLFVYYLYSSGHYEGQTAFQQAAAAFIAGLGPPGDNGLPDDWVVLDKQENLVGFLLAGQGYFLGRTRDPYTGQALLEQALAVLHRAETGDRHKEGFGLLWLGWMVFLQGSPALAQEYVEPTLAVLTKTGDRWAEGWGLLFWANTLCNVRPLEAEEVYERGLAVCRESGDKNTLGYTSQMRSEVNMNLGRYARAKQYIDEAVRAFEEVGNVLGLGYALTRRGELATFLGEYRQAIQAFQQARTNFDEVRTEQNVTWTQFDLGRVFRLQGDYDQAEQLYRQSLAASTARNHKADIAQCLLGLGCLAYDQGELRRAEQYQREALALCQQLELEVRMADVLSHLGQVMVAVDEQRYEEARQYFRPALELAIKHQLAPIALDVCTGVARLLAQVGEMEQAVELLALAEQHKASTFETREKARQRLADLMNQLPPETAQAAQTRGRTLDWQTAARRLIKVLSAEGEEW